MDNNYPLGVTGREYEIVGPDWEQDTDETCSRCDGGLVRVGYHQEEWSECTRCGRVTEIDYDPMADSDDLRDMRDDRW